MAYSVYQEPMEVRMGQKLAFAHIEHAPTEELSNYLSTRAVKEMRFYDDLRRIANEPRVERIEQFEDQNGSYEELTAGEHVDHHIMIAAVLNELKRRLAKVK